MRGVWKYLLLCFGLTWVVWIPGILMHASLVVLHFGSLGPVVAAFWVARSEAGGNGVRDLLDRMWRPCNWRWLGVGFLSIPAYLLLPAALARLAGLPLTMPPHVNGWGVLAGPGVLFGQNFFFTAVLEEPGWRGTLLPRFQESHSPLMASLLTWFPWMLWHAPLDLSGGAAHTLTGWLQIRVIFLIPMTILLTWIYNRSGGSLLCTALFHAGMNTFPSVLPWSRPMLAVVFVWVTWVILQERMWRQPSG